MRQFRKNFGFISDLLTQEIIFFHFSKVANLNEVDTIRVKDLVQYLHQPIPRKSIKEPDFTNNTRKSANKVVIIRSSTVIADRLK